MPRSAKSAKSDRKKKSASTDRGATGNKETKVVTWLPPPPALGERLLKALEHKPLEEKEIYGYKVSKRALKNLSQSEIKDLCDVFQIFDRDQTGFLRAKELYYAVKSLGFSISQRQCQDYIDSEVQINGESNGVSFSQFLDLVIDKQMNSKDYFDEILTGFDLFDYDAAGQISLAKLRIANDETGLGLTDTELKQMIQEADQNGDGFVDEEEFISVMLKTNLY